MSSFFISSRGVQEDTTAKEPGGREQPRPARGKGVCSVTAQDGAPRNGRGAEPCTQRGQALHVAVTPTSLMSYFACPELHGWHRVGSGDAGRSPRCHASSQCRGQQAPLFWALWGATRRGRQRGTVGAEPLPGGRPVCSPSSPSGPASSDRCWQLPAAENTRVRAGR